MHELRFGQGCSEDWEAMEQVDGGRRRACELCHKQVTDLSKMTEREALAFMDSRPPNACVYVLHDELGRALFLPEPAPSVVTAPITPRSASTQAAEAPRRVSPLAALALAAPLVLAACEPEEECATAQPPIELHDGQPARLGAASAPDYVPSDQIVVKDDPSVWRRFVELVTPRPVYKKFGGEMQKKVTSDVKF